MTESLLDLHVPNLEARIAPSLRAVEDLLLSSLQGSRELVDELTSHLARAGGKRIRPSLVLVCAQLGSEKLASSSPVIKTAAAMELTHLATLYHDDVMDSALTRRGVPSVQHLWGNKRAILAGDVLFARASIMVVELGIESVKYHAQTFERLCLGQLNETFGPEPGSDPLDFYLQVLADKTGSLLRASAHMGAYHAGVRGDVLGALGDFGEKIGVAFQIADDVIDLAVPGEKSGKTPGTDLREGVDTLPILLLRRHNAEGRLNAAGRDILKSLQGDLSSDTALGAVVDSIRKHSVLEEARALAHKWVGDAVSCLDIVPEGEPKDALKSFANLMVDRLV